MAGGVRMRCQQRPDTTDVADAKPPKAETCSSGDPYHRAHRGHREHREALTGLSLCSRCSLCPLWLALTPVASPIPDPVCQGTAYRPYSFQRRVTRSFVVWSMSSSFGHGRTLPSAGHLAV